MNDPDDKSNRSIITSKGLYEEQREVELQYKDQKQKLFANVLEESTVSFDHFSISKTI